MRETLELADKCLRADIIQTIQRKIVDMPETIGKKEVSSKNWKVSANKYKILERTKWNFRTEKYSN